ncbi:MAG: hypothetical protein R6X21_05015 [Candidatus Aminicenantes bacterium]
MSGKWLSFGRFALAAAVAVFMIPAGGTAGASMAAADAAGAEVVLTYKMPSGRILRYETKEDGLETMDMMGQVVETTSVSSSRFSLEPKGLRDVNHLLGVTIEDLTVAIVSMQGDVSPDVKPVLGRSFEMVLSPLGVEVDVSGAEAITYTTLSGTRNLASGFKAFFPDLPDRPVKVGDSWPSDFVIEEKTESVDIRIEGQNVHTLEGFETVDGMECARIVAKVSGTVMGTGFQQGMDLRFDGTLTGTDVWYFAPAEGVYVMSTSDSETDMTISVAGMSIPSKSKRTGEVRLAGK